MPIPGLVPSRGEGRGGRGDDAGPLLHPESPFRHPLHAGQGGLSEINQQLQHAAEKLKKTILQSNLISDCPKKGKFTLIGKATIQSFFTAIFLQLFSLSSHRETIKKAQLWQRTFLKGIYGWWTC